jgi:cbb3-type cytochrome oxidase subunit 3
MLTYAIFATANDQIMASSGSSDDGGGFIGLAFLASGFIFYAAIYFKYRNTNKRHHHESETEATLLNMEAQDEFVQARKGLSNRKMTGANNNDVRGSQRKYF